MLWLAGLGLASISAGFLIAMVVGTRRVASSYDATITRVGFRYGAQSGEPTTYKIPLQGIE